MRIKNTKWSLAGEFKGNDTKAPGVCKKKSVRFPRHSFRIFFEKQKRFESQSSSLVNSKKEKSFISLINKYFLPFLWDGNFIFFKYRKIKFDEKKNSFRHLTKLANIPFHIFLFSWLFPKKNFFFREQSIFTSFLSW